MDNNSILQKLDGLEARFEEVSTLITDPDVIGDQQRFVKLTKEYKDLGPLRGGDACIYQVKTNPVSLLPAPAGGRAPAALVTLDMP